MKPILFIDNDNADRAKEDLKGTVGFILEDIYGLSAEVDLMADFSAFLKDSKDIYETLFTKGYALAAFSSYCQGQNGDSFRQARALLATAGRNDVKGLVYLDLAGDGLFEKLHTMMDMGERPDPIPLLRAVETNFIISHDEVGLYRLRIDLTQYDLVHKERLSKDEFFTFMQEGGKEA